MLSNNKAEFFPKVRLGPCRIKPMLSAFLLISGSMLGPQLLQTSIAEEISPSCALSESDFDEWKGAPNLRLVDVETKSESGGREVGADTDRGEVVYALSLHDIKTKGYLKTKKVLILGKVHQKASLQAECENLRRAGFVSLRYVSGGWAGWLHATGNGPPGFRGKSAEWLEPFTISADEFATELNYWDWHIASFDDWPLPEELQQRVSRFSWSVSPSNMSGDSKDDSNRQLAKHLIEAVSQRKERLSEGSAILFIPRPDQEESLLQQLRQLKPGRTGAHFIPFFILQGGSRALETFVAERRVYLKTRADSPEASPQLSKPLFCGDK